MPLQNRVLPTGDIVSTPARGTLTGNRGILHVADGVMGPRQWAHKAWISCELHWQGRRLPVMQGRRWTALFFRDEPTALAAGHRPCGYCRRADYLAFRAAWQAATGTPAKAPDMDRVLHAARTGPRTLVGTCASLPQGCFVMHDGAACLWWQDRLHPYGPAAYAAPRTAPSAPVKLLTPAPMVAVLRAGYRPRAPQGLAPPRYP